MLFYLELRRFILLLLELRVLSLHFLPGRLVVRQVVHHLSYILQLERKKFNYVFLLFHVLGQTTNLKDIKETKIKTMIRGAGLMLKFVPSDDKVLENFCLKRAFYWS